MDQFLIEICLDISDFDTRPEEIGKLLQLKAFSTSMKGEKPKGRNSVSQRSNWSIRSKPQSDQKEAQYSIEAHWNDIFVRVHGKESVLKKLSETARIDLTILVRSNGRYPSVKISKRILEFAQNAGVHEIDIDIQE